MHKLIHDQIFRSVPRAIILMMNDIDLSFYVSCLTINGFDQMDFNKITLSSLQYEWQDGCCGYNSEWERRPETAFCRKLIKLLMWWVGIHFLFSFDSWQFIFHFFCFISQKEMLLNVHFGNLSLIFMFNCSWYESYAFSSYIF